MGFIRGLRALVVMGFLAYLFVAFIADGYLDANIFPDELEPDAWAAPDSWSEWLDIAIVCTAIFWIIALIVLIAAAFILLRPSEETVCARVVELTPAGHPHPPDEASCKSVLAMQRTIEWP